MRFATTHAVCLIFAMAVLSAPAVAKSRNADEPDELRILGWVEYVHLIEPGFELKAKLDTGARTSSLDARIIKKFRQYGKRWVRFAVRHPETGEETVLVRERERTIGIVQHEGENDVRPTVIMAVCLAGKTREIEVSLVDRSRFEYPMLVGRRALKRFALIDSGETFLSEPDCQDQGKEAERGEEAAAVDEPAPSTERSSDTAPTGPFSRREAGS